MSKGSRGAIERALEDKYWRQDEGFQAGSRQVPGNLRAREPEDSFREGCAAGDGLGALAEPCASGEESAPGSDLSSLESSEL